MKSTLEPAEIRRRLAALQLDDPDAGFSFTDRLARENRWTADYARRVIEEYRRFAYLAMTTRHEVTPSDEVDQAWHLHMTYTRHYWGAFADALGAPLHHNPTKGGAAEREKFLAQYERTLASYEKAFGERAPADIWPDARIRFGEAPFMRRINTRRKFVIDKRLVFAPVVAAIAGAALVSVGHAQESDIERQLTDAFIEHPVAFVVISAVVLMLVFNVLFKRGRGKGGDGGGCSAGCGDSGCGGCGGD